VSPEHEHPGGDDIGPEHDESDHQAHAEGKKSRPHERVMVTADEPPDHESGSSGLERLTLALTRWLV
jgi:hypothetical protein